MKTVSCGRISTVKGIDMGTAKINTVVLFLLAFFVSSYAYAFVVNFNFCIFCDFMNIKLT
jgi:hypothetical protein